MRKICILLFLAALISTGSQAQTTQKSRLNWGIKTGLNASKLNAETSTSWDEDWKTGFVFGAFFNIKAGSKFSVQPEFLYSSMGGNVSNSLYSERHRLNYFSIPVLAKLNIGKGFSVVAGPQIDMLISAKTRASNTENVLKSTNNFNEQSFNLTGGVEFFPGKCFGLSARYIHGLSNAWNTSGPSNTMEFRNQGVQLTAAIRL
jgi:hypothetical protein